MRVLFTVFASSSHFNLQVPLAWALRAAGHEVCVASQPDLEEAIKDAGLIAVPVGEPLNLGAQAQGWGETPEDGSFYRTGLDINETDPGKLTWDYVRGTLGLYCGVVSEFLAGQSMLDDLVEFARAWRPDLVVWDAMTYVGPVAARACGAAQARTVFGPDHFGRMRAVFHELAAGQSMDFGDDPVAAWLGGRLPPSAGEFTEDLAVGQLTIDPTWRWARLPSAPECLPMRFVPYGGRASFPALALEPTKRPRVCLTLGLAARSIGLSMPSIPDLLAAVAAMDIEVIATLNASQLETVAEVPDNVRVFDFVPLDELLPTCSAIIHHLGTGSTGAALTHGVPQLCVSDERSLWGEQGVGQRLVDRGAALSIVADEFTPETMRAQLARLLEDESFAEQATRLQREALATPSPHEVVPELEALVARNRI